jgi:hypothetical protein
MGAEHLLDLSNERSLLVRTKLHGVFTNSALWGGANGEFFHNRMAIEIAA